MTRLFDDAAGFAEDVLAGFADAYPHYVRAVPGGVVRSRPERNGKVALVVGGGCGHYPAGGTSGVLWAAAFGGVLARPARVETVR